MRMKPKRVAGETGVCEELMDLVDRKPRIVTSLSVCSLTEVAKCVCDQQRALPSHSP